jgi:UDPglucose 6-dehydrogenase
LLVATEWEEFRQLDWALIRETMSRPLILDGRNFLQADTMRALGFEYYGVGRPVEEPAREAIA